MKSIRTSLMLGVATLFLASHAQADALKISPVGAANEKIEGAAKETVLAAEFTQKIMASGAMKLENPAAMITHYGYNGDGPIVPAAGDVQAKGHNVEASKTEPDKNTYLVLANQKGPDANYDYGTHFVFQGHEAGAVVSDRPQGYLTRVNLDADKDSDGATITFIDGSSYNPFAQRLLLTGEEGDEGGVWQATTSFPSTVDNLTGVMGIGSYEGVQTDKDGNIWLVEDEGGKTGEVNKRAKQPNSFVYRFTPVDKADLKKGGKLEALQVLTTAGNPIIWNDGKIDDDVLSPALKELHTYGNNLKTKWVLVHDTAKDGMTPFKANTLAKAAMASPMKRPENGVFRPGTDFTEFYFTATGDTNAETEAKEEFGGFGGIFKLSQSSPSAAEGMISIVYRGNVNHTGFDNIQFASADELMIVEDAGDKLHSQRKAFDCGYVLDLKTDYSKGAEPVRFLALGRDPSATIDSKLAAEKDTGFQNSGDNEITGIHVSDGDASIGGLLGAKVPNLLDKGWRMFYSQQHGDNRLFEVTYNTTM
jgi:Bacterial protein of unknown function (DUF839)